jgi:hypothetical protein
MPNLLTPDQAKRLTEPFHPLWVDAYRHSEKKMLALRDYDAESFLAFEPPTVARMMRDHTVRKVRADEKVLGSDALATFTQILSGEDGSALVRFKELDTELRRFNHKSGRQDGLDRHAVDSDDYGQLVLDGLKGNFTILTCGYVRDFDILVVSRIVVVCHWGRTPLWSYNPETGAAHEVQPLPGLIEPPQSTVRPVTRQEGAVDEAES